jgi:site-specific DNA-methyltransferase (adenine-specific)
MNNKPAMILGDCMDYMASMDAQSVDAIVTDPPYQQTSLAWDKWVKGWPKAAARVLKPGGSMWVFGTLRMFMDYRDDFSEWSMAQDIVWEKHNGSSFHADRFRRVHEQAVQFYQGPWADVYKGQVVTNDAKKRSVNRSGNDTSHHYGRRNETSYRTEEGDPRIMRSVIYARSQHGQAIHPTQKPEAIIEPLILNCCAPGGLILDPFAGSGTTGFVAQRIGRRSIMVEGNPAYFEAMNNRFSADLFGGAA